MVFVGWNFFERVIKNAINFGIFMTGLVYSVVVLEVVQFGGFFVFRWLALVVCYFDGRRKLDKKNVASSSFSWDCIAQSSVYDQFSNIRCNDNIK